MKIKPLFLFVALINISFVSCMNNNTTTQINTDLSTVIETQNTTLTTYTPETLTTTNEDITFNIFFETNGGSLDPYIIENLNPSDVVNLPTPSKTGYIFCGWFYSTDDDVIVNEITIGNSDVTLYADWGSIGLDYQLINNDTEYEVSIGDIEDTASISIPKFYQNIRVTRIANQGFAFVENMKEIVIPNTITEIGAGAFLKAFDLQKVSIPSSIEIIGSTAFRDCQSLEAFNVSQDSLFFKSIDGILYNHDQSILIRYPQSKNNTEFIIPLSVSTVREDAFANNRYLTSITITENVTTINDHAFYNCTSLINIDIPDNVTSVGIYLFRESSVQEVTIGSGLTTISSYMFSGCYELEAITIPSSIENIGYAAFEYCSKLTSVIISKPGSSGLISGSLFMFNNTNLQLKIYFLDENTIELYENESYWSSYKSRFEVLDS